MEMDDVEEDEEMGQEQIIGEIIPSTRQVLPFFGQRQLPLPLPASSSSGNHQE